MIKIRTVQGDFYISEEEIESFNQCLEDIWDDLDMNQNIDDWRECFKSREDLILDTLDLCDDYVERDSNTRTIKFKG